jgi:hypothetical protein
MGNNTGRNQNPPQKEDIDFLYTLLWQSSNDFLINYISYSFNSIQPRSLRLIKIQDWLTALNWLGNKFLCYDDDDFENFCKKHFVESFMVEYIDNVFKAFDFLNSLESYEDLEVIGDGNFQRFIQSSLEDIDSKEKARNEYVTRQASIFDSQSLTEKAEMIELYNEYIEERNIYINNTDTSIFLRRLYSKIDFIQKKLEEEFNIDVELEMINNICKRFIEVKSTEHNTKVTDEELSQIIQVEISSFNNLTLIAYYTHYILLSLGISIQNQTLFGVKKIAGKQGDIMQRLLCAFTTKNWERAEQKSNAYYKTINNMYKFDRQDEWEKKNLLKQLEMVKVMLTNGNFVEAIRILDEDVEKIIQYK